MSALGRLGLTPTDLAGSEPASPAQEQTGRSFGYLWSQRHSYESDAAQAFAARWLVDRYCDGDRAVLDRWLDGDRKIILDAGCGAAYSALSLFGDRLRDHDYLGVDISGAVEVARRRFRERGLPGDFLRMSLLDLSLPPESVDLIFSEGVLHHTDHTETSFKRLARFLKPGGRFLFYVYARKAPVRELTDDHVRRQLQPLSDEEAWQALYPLTRLGIALGELDVEIDVPEDVPLLGIKKGKMDLQRFVYWNVCKMFYRPEYSLEEMNHMNFDWFRPLNCHRHAPEEVARWCRDLGFETEVFNVEEAGITVVARKQPA